MLLAACIGNQQLRMKTLREGRTIGNLVERGGDRRQVSGQTGIFSIVLAVLWHEVVKPILDVLGYTVRLTS